MRPIRLLSISAGTLLVLLAASSPLAAQGRPPAARDSAPAVPREMLPPPGKCRIWVAGVPAKQQPAATDCATALRQNPSNGTVIYGPRPKADDAVDFDSPNRPTVDPRDSVRKSKNAPPLKKSEPAKKPVDPPTKKPERP